MDVSLKQLRLLVALADSGSISGAARLLHVTQPTASMQLKALSEVVGLPLHEVIGKRVHLTEAGQALVETARNMQQSWEDFTQQADAWRGLSRGRLRVAVVSTAKYFMPRLIGQFCRTHPGIDLSLEILNRDGVVTRLRENRDDLYIMSQPPMDIPLEDSVFLPNPIEVIAPADLPSDQLPNDLVALLQHQLILREPGSGTRMAVDRCLANAGLIPRIRLELGSNEAIKESVAGGLGLGIVSRHAISPLTPSDNVVVLSLPGFPLPAAWHLVHPASKRLSPVAQAFKDHLLLAAQQLSENG
jgi:DNA-binding transcriptional LysR family regulator